MSDSDRQLTLAILRQRAGLTQRKMADELGITIKTISSWERGVVEPRLTALEMKRLMEVLHCTFEELLLATQGQTEEP